MAYEIIYICNSLNNKNIREGELNILEKHEEQLCFEFGSDRMNIKKRYYNDIETLNKDFDNLLKLKETENKMKNKKEKEEEKQEKKKIEEKKVIAEPVINKENANKKLKDVKFDDEKANSKLDKYKIIKRKK